MSNTPVEFLSWDQNQPKENVFDENCVIMSYFMGELLTTVLIQIDLFDK